MINGKTRQIMAIIQIQVSNSHATRINLKIHDYFRELWNLGTKLVEFGKNSFYNLL